MQEKLTIARPYARAAFEHAQETGTLAEWSELFTLLNIVISDKNMGLVLNHPKLNNEEFILDICADKLSATSKRFVHILTAAGRLALIPEIRSLYEEKRAQAESTIEVEVISAYPLTAEQQTSIAKTMAKHLNKKIEIKNSTDRTLIGGAIIRAGDSVIDASIKGRLKLMANELIA